MFSECIVRHLGREPDFWAENRKFKNFLKILKTCLVGVFWVFQGITGDPLHSRAACTQPCNVNTHSRAHYCSPGAWLCEQWGHGCVNNGARLCASARLCRGSPVDILVRNLSREPHFWAENRIFENFSNSLKTWFVGVFWVFFGFFFSIVRHLSREPDFEPRTRFSKSS